MGLVQTSTAHRSNEQSVHVLPALVLSWHMSAVLVWLDQPMKDLRTISDVKMVLIFGISLSIP